MNITMNNRIRFFAGKGATSRKANEYFHLFVDGTRVGYILTRSVDNRFEIMCHINKQARGRGYATQALAMLVRKHLAFGTSKLLFVNINHDDITSWHVADNCGFYPHAAFESYSTFIIP